MNDNEDGNRRGGGKGEMFRLAAVTFIVTVCQYLYHSRRTVGI
jgi:hypothetical protein